MRSFILSIILFICFNSEAQFSGYYGKKTYVESAYQFNFPIFYLIFNNGDYGYDDNLYPKIDLFNFGYRFSAGRMLSNHFGLAFDYIQDFSQVRAPGNFTQTYTDSWGYPAEYSIFLRHEMLDLETKTFIPKIEVSMKSIMPLGISHQFGIGYSISTIKQRKYEYEYGYGYYNEEPPKLPLNLDSPLNITESRKGIVFLYALNVKVNLTKSVLLNYGIRYNLNLGLKNNFVDEYGLYYSELDDFNVVESYINKQRFLNIVNANIGLTYVF